MGNAPYVNLLFSPCRTSVGQTGRARRAGPKHAKNSLTHIIISCSCGPGLLLRSRIGPLVARQQRTQSLSSRAAPPEKGETTISRPAAVAIGLGSEPWILSPLLVSDKDSQLIPPIAGRRRRSSNDFPVAVAEIRHRELVYGAHSHTPAPWRSVRDPAAPVGQGPLPLPCRLPGRSLISDPQFTAAHAARHAAPPAGREGGVVFDVVHPECVQSVDLHFVCIATGAVLDLPRGFAEEHAGDLPQASDRAPLQYCREAL